MNKEADQPKGPDAQEQKLPKIGKEKLQEILAQHKRWVESEGIEGARAILGGANLQEAELRGANLQGANLVGANLQGASLVGANLQGATGLTASQVKAARYWKRAFYSGDFLTELGLPSDLNQFLCMKFPKPPVWCRDFVDQP